MGRLDDYSNGPTNPVEMRISYHGSEGQFYFLRKDDPNEKAKQVLMKHEAFSFIPIKSYMTVRGYNAVKDESVWANKRGLKDHNGILKVRSGQEVIAEGKWRDIKGEVEGSKGKYTEMVIALGITNETGASKLVEIEINGAAMGGRDENKNPLEAGWVHFGEKYGLGKATWKISINGLKQGKIGAVTYQVPVFTAEEVKDEALIAVIDNHYDTVKEYLDAVTTYSEDQGSNESEAIEATIEMLKDLNEDDILKLWENKLPEMLENGGALDEVVTFNETLEHIGSNSRVQANLNNPITSVVEEPIKLGGTMFGDGEEEPKDDLPF